MQNELDTYIEELYEMGRRFPYGYKTPEDKKVLQYHEMHRLVRLLLARDSYRSCAIPRHGLLTKTAFRCYYDEILSTFDEVDRKMAAFFNELKLPQYEDYDQLGGV